MVCVRHFNVEMFRLVLLRDMLATEDFVGLRISRCYSFIFRLNV